MARRLDCPQCGEAEELRGDQTEDGIFITCLKCDTVWPRDSGPMECATCGGTDIEFRPQANTQYSRGTQLSITGWRAIPLCAECDADMLSRSLSGKPVSPHYQSAARHRREQPQAPSGDDHRLTPK